MRSATRLEIIVPTPGQRRWVALVRTDDPDGTLAWRSSPAGQRSQGEAAGRAQPSRAGFGGRRVYEATKP